MNKDILVLGEGFIGSRLKEEIDCSISGKIINNFEDAEQLVKENSPRILINCVGFTGGKNVDGCELKKEMTMQANVFVPALLAEACIRDNVKFIHISSGCIYHYDYEKDQPIAEDKEPDFYELFYSRSKIYSEKILNSLMPKYNILVVRIRIPLDDKPSPKNVLDKLINYRNVIDVPNSVTYIPDFVKAMLHLIKIDARGIYNVVNRGGLRYPDLMELYKRHNPDFQYNIIDVKKLDLVRTNLLLSVDKLSKSGFQVRDIKEVLEECVENYVKY